MQGDALEYDLSGFDFVWASPPCQAYSYSAQDIYRRRHPRLIPTVRARLAASGLPYIIENVQGAKRALQASVLLCGSMFGLPVRRHRLFELSPHVGLPLTPQCDHSAPIVHLTTPGSFSRKVIRDRGKTDRYQGRGEVVCINWMTSDELSQAIPPAYSRYLAQFISLPVESAA